MVTLFVVRQRAVQFPNDSVNKIVYFIDVLFGEYYFVNIFREEARREFKERIFDWE